MALPSTKPPLTSCTQPVRVLVVDDSAYMRHIISRYLDGAAGLTVVGAARDGAEALAMVEALEPDVVTLDVEMPRLDGLAALREIMTRWPRPVVMLSSLTARGASETMQALTWGAVDFVAKPEAKANVMAVLDEVVTKVRLAARARVWSAPRARAARLCAGPSKRAGPGLVVRRSLAWKTRDKVVVIGASTGGPRALNAVVSALPADLPAALLMVQHMPVGFTPALAERLNDVSTFAIKEAEPGDALEAGRGLLAPGGFHMTLDRDERIALDKNPTVHGVRPAIDVTMTAAAQHFGQATIGVILTGMGSDGTQGAMLIHSMGGKVIAESEETCVVWGMPRSVAEAGMADAIVPLPEVAGEIVRAVSA